MTAYSRFMSRLIPFCLSGALAGCAPSASFAPLSVDPDSYREQVIEYRHQKDTFFRESERSPIPAAKRDSFTGLEYFPPDPRYRVIGRLKPAEKPRHVVAAGHAGDAEKLVSLGDIAFTLDGTPVEFEVWQKGNDRPMVIFRDGTSGRETYGTGRYVDLEPAGDGLYIIDFNFAYNPYCAYDPARYLCPLPPPGNVLAVPVRAGEMLWKGESSHE
ncbi:MAG: DUF1684 domain-containing protein [Deltaproteobacteria bacterium]